MLEQLNKFINNIFAKFQPQPEFEEVGENLIKEDFSQKGILTGADDVHSIKLPTPEVAAIAEDPDKISAHEKFLSQTKMAEPLSAAPISNEMSPKIADQNTPLQSFESQSGHLLRGAGFAVGALLLLALAYFVFQYAEKVLNSSVAVSNNNFVFDNSLVRADDTRTMSVEAGVAREVIRSSILQTMYNEDVKLDKLVLVTPSYLRESTQDGKKVFVSELLRADDFLFTFAPAAPLALRTAISGDYALGMVNATGKPEAFVALSMNERVSGFRELMRYEQFMYQDLKETFRLRDFVGEPKWKDITVNNHDLRALTDNEGVVFVYGFASSQAAVLAANVDVFEKVSQRLK